MKRKWYLGVIVAVSLLFACHMNLFANPSSGDPSPVDPIYIVLKEGYKGLYGPHNEYVEFVFPKRKETIIQDAHHILLNKKVGMMVTFVDKEKLGANKDTLEAHLRWELEYWRKQTNQVESATRSDLSASRNDVRATEIKLTDKQGVKSSIYLIALAGKGGVFVLGISPADPSIDPVAKDIVNSFKLVSRKLDVVEIKRVSKEAASQK